MLTISSLSLSYSLHGSFIEQLDVSALHVLLVFGHCSVGLLLTGEDDLGIATGSVVSVVLNHNILTVSNGTEPLQHKLLTDALIYLDHTSAMSFSVALNGSPLILIKCFSE